MIQPVRITGTFLDEITHDIPSQNWGSREWRREFELYSRIGIDTLIVIRSGYRNRCIFPSRAIPDLLPVYDDLGALFLELAETFGLTLYFGLYDSGRHWMRHAWWHEVDLNKHFIEELVERYGSSPAFGGWYLPHESSRYDYHIDRLFKELGPFCRAARDVPVLISPFPQGAKQFSSGDAFTLDESFDHWRHLFEETQGAFDICAFQDGQIHYQELPRFLEGIAELGREFGVRIWSNLESFDRDMPIKFPPADWRNLRFKMESAAPFVEKLITFEGPHFLSPNSCYPAAQNLFARYAEYAGLDPDAFEIDDRS